jgi:hypothetical protein
MLSLDRVKRRLVLIAVALLAGRSIWLYVIPAWSAIITEFSDYYVSAWASDRHREYGFTGIYRVSADAR